MTNTVTGGCLCGAVRYAIEAGPGSGMEAAEIPGYYCHCSMCRKATGGAYACLLSVPKGAIAWTRDAPTVYRSSPLASRGFCGRCGSPLFYDGDDEVDFSITVGSLDNPAAVKPGHHYGIESRLPWVDAGQGLPGRETEERFDGQPP